MRVRYSRPWPKLLACRYPLPAENQSISNQTPQITLHILASSHPQWALCVARLDFQKASNSPSIVNDTSGLPFGQTRFLLMVCPIYREGPAPSICGITLRVFPASFRLSEEVAPSTGHQHLRVDKKQVQRYAM